MNLDIDFKSLTKEEKLEILEKLNYKPFNILDYDPVKVSESDFDNMVFESGYIKNNTRRRWITSQVLHILNINKYSKIIDISKLYKYYNKLPNYRKSEIISRDFINLLELPANSEYYKIRNAVLAERSIIVRDYIKYLKFMFELSSFKNTNGLKYQNLTITRNDVQYLIKKLSNEPVVSITKNDWHKIHAVVTYLDKQIKHNSDKRIFGHYSDTFVLSGIYYSMQNLIQYNNFTFKGLSKEDSLNKIVSELKVEIDYKVRRNMQEHFMKLIDDNRDKLKSMQWL